MNAISEQIQEPELIAEMEEPEIVAGAIADGSQAIAHDGFDVETFERAAGDYARLSRTVEETAGAIRTGAALMRDLFWSFHKRAPRIAPIAPLSPAYEINQQIIEQILSTTEWREMRESGTVGDLLSSAMATIGCAGSAIEALGQETIRQINQLHELSAEVEQLFARAETLNELAALSQDAERSEQLKKEAAQAKADAEKKEKKVERLNRKLDESSEAREQKVRRAVRQGLAEAMAEVEQANDAIKAFGGGYDAGFGIEAGAGRRNSLSTKEKIAIAQKVGRSPKLQQIAAVCGRFTRIALQQQKTRVKHPPDEITSITTGCEIERLLPSEIALLADPGLEDLFYLKFVERGLMQYDLIGHEPEGQGPIILAVDESESMSWMCGPMTKEVWSKAVMLALLSIARLQKRDFAIIHFSGESNIKVEVFPKGQATAQETIACASHFFNGGTVFDEWMDEALGLVGQSAFDKADSICVSDGVGRLKPETLAIWQKMRADRGMRSYSILVGTSEGEQLLWQISDAVFCLDDLAEDIQALEAIFSV
ncbi:MAG: Protein ViaA [Gammaproteobacteria bacterium]|nr:Protein ViaA [Gammaproteobacteria bacterium]